MSMRRSEDHHNSAEQVEGYVREAMRIADAIPLLEEERLALLPVLVTLLAGKQVFYEQVGGLPNLAIPRH